jgi:hypothetical protein
MKSYWGMGVGPHFLDLGTNWRVSGQLHAPALNPRGKRTRYSLLQVNIGQDRKPGREAPADLAIWISTDEYRIATIKLRESLSLANGKCRSEILNFLE